MSDDETAIRALLLAREAAILRGDAAAALTAYAEDIVNFDLAPPLRMVGPAARDRDALQQWFDTWDGGPATRLSEIAVVVDGDLAAVWGLLQLRGISRDGGRAVDEWSRNSVVLARRDGKWRIIHEHSSYPLRMDGSGMAAVDLLP